MAERKTGIILHAVVNAGLHFCSEKTILNGVKPPKLSLCVHHCIQWRTQRESLGRQILSPPQAPGAPDQQRSHGWATHPAPVVLGDGIRADPIFLGVGDGGRTQATNLRRKAFDSSKLFVYIWLLPPGLHPCRTRWALPSPRHPVPTLTSEPGYATAPVF